MFSILTLSVNHQKLTAQELAEKLEVSKRTIYRDLESLNLAEETKKEATKLIEKAKTRII